MKISIITPFYNEEKMVKIYIKELFNVLNNIKNCIFEVMCVNDGSTDKTLELLKKEHDVHKEIKIISFSKNFGHEAAINAGINNCSGDAAIIMDADLQDPPSHIIKLIRKFEEGYDVVNVKRIDRSSDSFFKRATAKMFYKLISKWSYKIKIDENVNNFRLISKRVINVVKCLTEKNKVFRFEIPFTGFKTTYIELVRPKRAEGKTHYNLKSMNKLAIDSIISVSTEPLNLISKLFIFIFMCFSISSTIELILFIVQIINHSLNISNLSYVSWLVINCSLLLTSIIMFSLAVIAQYIARIHIETQNRPMYVIEEIMN